MRSLLAIVLIGSLLSGCREPPEGSLRIVPQLRPARPRQVAWAPGNRGLLAVLEMSGRIGIWDVRDPDAPVLIASINAGALDFDFAPDGRALVTTGSDGRVRRWRTDGQLDWTSPEGHEAVARAVAVGPDFIVSGSDRGDLRIWTSEGAALSTPAIADGAPILSLAVAPNGELISVAGNGAVRLWKRAGGSAASFESQILYQPVPALGAPSQAAIDPQVVPHLAAVSSSGAIAGAVSDGALRMWNAAGQPTAEIPGTHGRLDVRAVAFSPSGNHLASGGLDGTLRLWSADGSPLGEPIRAHEGGVYSLAFWRDDRHLVSTGADGRVRLWHADGRALAELPMREEERIAAAALSPNDLLAAVATDAGAVYLASLDGGPTTMIAEQPTPATALAFAAAGDEVAVGYKDGGVRAWGIDGTPRAALLSPDGAPIAALAVEPGWLAAAGKVLRIVARDRTEHLAPPVALDSFSAVAFTKQGDVVVAGTLLGRLHVLNRDGAPRVLPFKAPSQPISAIAFAQQGERFASAGGMESIVRLWRLDGLPDDPPLQGHLAPVTALATSPDGAVLASGSADGTVRLWRLPARQPDVIDVGLPVDQLGFWRHALWVRAGETVLFFDPARQGIATSILSRDGAFTFTGEGWFAGSAPVRVFDAAGRPLSERKTAQRASPEFIRARIQRGAEIPPSLNESAGDDSQPG